MAEKTPTYNSKSIAVGTWVNTTSCTTGSCATIADTENAPYDLVTTTYGTFTSASTYLGGLGSCTSISDAVIANAPPCAHCKCDLRGAENNLCRPCRELLKRGLIKRNNQGEYVKWDAKEPLHDSIRPEPCTIEGLSFTQEYSGTFTTTTTANVAWDEITSTDSS